MSRRDIYDAIGYQIVPREAGLLLDVDGDPSDALELLAAGRPAWHADAACKEHDPKLWFPGRGANPHDIRKARAVCAGCLVRRECKTWALAEGPELEGIWGGLSKADRHAIRMGRRAA